MKPRTSPRSVPKSAPDRKSGTTPYAAIPEWAEKTPSGGDTDGALHRGGTKSSKTSLTRSIALDRLTLTQRLRVGTERSSAAHPASVTTQSDGRQNSDPSRISAKSINGDSEPLLTIGDAARLLTVSEKTVRRLIDRGELNAVRVGRSVRIRPEVLAAYIDRRTA